MNLGRHFHSYFIDMSCNYAEGLSPYENKGEVGMTEFEEDAVSLDSKATMLADLLRDSTWTVFHTGAGISTAAGIPDFRGPKGVWTLEKKGDKPQTNISFDTAQPTYTHNFLNKLWRNNKLKFIVNQNIDGLHLKAGTPQEVVADMHGNVFIEQCCKCRKQVVRECCVPTVGLKYTGNKCPFSRGSLGDKLKCRGKMRDTILDWEDDLPTTEMNLAEFNCKQAQLAVCLGTSLQIYPCRTLPLMTKRNGGKIVIVNLQKTPLDKYAYLRIFGKVDEVMQIVDRELGFLG